MDDSARPWLGHGARARARSLRRVVGPLALGAMLGLVSACADGSQSEEEAAPALPEIQGIRGTVPEASGGIGSVVTLEPKQPMPELEATPVAEEVTIEQFGLAFSPTAVIVPSASVLRFTNYETSLVHNVKVVSIARDSTVFTGDAAPGEVLMVPLFETGGYDVLCDYHPGMTAFAFATDAPLATIADVDGSFEILAPPGAYTLRVWSTDPSRRSEHDVVVGTGTTSFVANEPG